MEAPNAAADTNARPESASVETARGQPPLAPSALATNIIATLAIYPTNVSVTVVSNAASAMADTTNAVETVIVRPPPGMRDGFMYTIVIDHQTRQYWVERSGGIAGRRERRGPISCDDHRVLPEAKRE